MTTLLLLLTFFAAPPVHYVSWTHTGLDIQGQPESLISVQYAISFDGQGPDTPIDSWTRAIGPTPAGQPYSPRHDITDHVNNLQTGLKYRIHARVQDAAGNWSTWTTSTNTLDLIEPTAPKDLKS